MSITPLRFTGITSFSEDFQKILSRAVQIASIPIQQLQNQQADLLTKKQALTALNADLRILADAVAALGDIGANRALTAVSSSTNRVAVTLAGASAPATYTITEINSVAQAASETSLSGYATANSTPVDGGDDLLELVLGNNTYTLDLASYGNHLNGLQDAINALGIGVRASVLNTGSATDPYYLSVTATSPGATTLQLRTVAGDPDTNLLTAANQGSNAVFKLNGLPVTKADNVISDVAPGVIFTIVSKTEANESVFLTLASNRGTLAMALERMVDAYNAVADRLKQHIGENAGLLSGDYLIRRAQTVLRQLTGHQGSGTLKSLADLGVELSKSGVMSFHSAKFYSLPTDTINAAFDFLGSRTLGFGGLSGVLTQLADPVTGLIKTQQNHYDAADKRISAAIATLTARIERMQVALSEKLQQADVLLNSLQRQQTALAANLESVRMVTFGKQREL